MTKEFFNDLFIFEMANNHQGSVEHGKRIIEEMAAIARKHGIRAAVKLQYRNLDTFIHPDQLKTKSNKHVERFLSTRLDEAQMRELAVAIKAAGLSLVITPFDEDSVDQAVAHGVDVLKVASCSADDWPLLERIAASGRPVIVSTGGQPLAGIDNLYSFLDHRGVDFAILHCVSVYPTQPEDQHLNFIDRLRRRYPNVVIGYSGHEPPDDLSVVSVAVGKGAGILERHVGVPADGITLNAYSMNPGQTDAWVAAALKARKICGLPEGKQITSAEHDSLLALSRGVYARQDLKKGEVLSADSVFFAFPAQPGQMTSGQWKASMKADRVYKAREAVGTQKTSSDTQTVRQFIHEFRGMFNEAGILLNDDIEIELSHHYGLNRFREVGALIVNVVNREYCKKLVAQLPGQTHPLHRHMKKEETFQVVWGSMTAVLNDVEREMGVGELLLVRRGDWHNFRTDTGVIFEEVSTRHVNGDSYYSDPGIASADPINRKTFLKAW